MSKPPPKPAKPGKSDCVSFLFLLCSGQKSDDFLLRATHLVADVGPVGGEVDTRAKPTGWKPLAELSLNKDLKQ